MAAVIQPFEAPQKMKMKEKKISGTTVKRERESATIKNNKVLKNERLWLLAGWLARLYVCAKQHNLETTIIIIKKKSGI